MLADTKDGSKIRDQTRAATVLLCHYTIQRQVQRCERSRALIVLMSGLPHTHCE